jgi:hypothetical protein
LQHGLLEQEQKAQNLVLDVIVIFNSNMRSEGLMRPVHCNVASAKSGNIGNG